MEETLLLEKQKASSQTYREQEIIFSWLLQKKEGTTRRNYKREVEKFFGRFHGVSLKEISVGHLSVFLSERDSLSLSSKKFAKDVLSSLLSFALKLGYLDRSPADVLDTIRVPDKTSGRLLTEEQVFRIIDRAENLRDFIIMKLLYASGMRVTELSNLGWKNFYPKADGGVQVVVHGKGDKMRSIVLPENFWLEIQTLKTLAKDLEGFCFISRQKNGKLTTSQIRRIVKASALRAKISENVSPHWFRHGHATHALERGAPIHLVQKTLGHASVATTGKYLDASPTESSSKFLGI